MSKKSMIRNRPISVRMRNLRQKVETGKKTCSESITRFPLASCFEKTRDMCQKIGGRMNDGVPGSGKGMIRFLCSQEKRQETSK